MHTYKDKRGISSGSVPCLYGKLTKLGGVVPYGYIHPRTTIQQVTVPVKIDGRQEQEENIGAFEPGSMYTHVGHARYYKYSIFNKNMRSWVAWCFMEAFILIVMSNCNLLTVLVKIDGRQQHEETRSLLNNRGPQDKRGISSAVPS